MDNKTRPWYEAGKRNYPRFDHLLKNESVLFFSFDQLISFNYWIK